MPLASELIFPGRPIFCHLMSMPPDTHTPSCKSQCTNFRVSKIGAHNGNPGDGGIWPSGITNLGAATLLEQCLMPAQALQALSGMLLIVHCDLIDTGSQGCYHEYMELSW